MITIEFMPGARDMYPEATTNPSSRFHPPAQYSSSPYAKCFITISTENTARNTKSHISSTCVCTLLELSSQGSNKASCIHVPPIAQITICSNTLCSTNATIGALQSPAFLSASATASSTGPSSSDSKSE